MRTIDLEDEERIVTPSALPPPRPSLQPVVPAQSVPRSATPTATGQNPAGTVARPTPPKPETGKGFESISRENPYQ